MEEKKQLTANQLTNVKEIKKSFLYSKDNHIFGYLRVHFYNIDLLSKEERRNKTNMLASAFEGDHKDFAYLSYPREIDLDFYKENLKKKYSEELSNIGKKHILQEMIMEAVEISSNGENYEHQHFIKLWQLIGPDKNDSENQLRNRLEDFKAKFEAAGIHVEILTEEEDIMKLCNLFANTNQAPYEQYGKNQVYEPIMKLR